MPPQSAIAGAEGTIMGIGQKESRADKSKKAGNVSRWVVLLPHS